MTTRRVEAERSRAISLAARSQSRMQAFFPARHRRENIRPVFSVRALVKGIRRARFTSVFPRIERGLAEREPAGVFLQTSSSDRSRSLRSLAVTSTVSRVRRASGFVLASLRAIPRPACGIAHNEASGFLRSHRGCASRDSFRCLLRNALVTAKQARARTQKSLESRSSTMTMARDMSLRFANPFMRRYIVAEGRREKMALHMLFRSAYFIRLFTRRSELSIASRDMFSYSLRRSVSSAVYRTGYISIFAREHSVTKIHFSTS